MRWPLLHKSDANHRVLCQRFGRFMARFRWRHNSLQLLVLLAGIGLSSPALAQDKEPTVQPAGGAPSPSGEMRGATDGFLPLFHGGDLTGWTPMLTTGRGNDVHRPTTGGWVVKNGELVCATDRNGWLRSERKYGDFVLQLEFKLRPGGNSGIYIRSSDSGTISRMCMEIQIIDPDYKRHAAMLTAKQQTGAIYGVVGPPRPPLRPMGEWNSLEIRCAGDSVEVVLNGEPTARANMSQEPALRDRWRSGFIGLSNWHGEAMGMSFRDIRIKELSAAAGAKFAGPPASVGGAESAAAALVRSELLFERAPFRSCHASTIAETPHGLAVAYFAGTREGAEDVDIWLSRQKQGIWLAPVDVANGIISPGARSTCGNPVLFQVPRGPLLLFYKTRSKTNRGAGPYHLLGMLKTSADDGRTWSAPRELPEGLIGPEKNKPLLLPGGDLLCSSSIESRVRFEHTADLGRTWQVTADVDDDGRIAPIQPTVLVHPGGRLQALARTRQHKISETWSDDGGRTWSPMTLTALPNPYSGIDAVTLADGRHLLVYNHTRKDRSPLNVAVSEDGKEWLAALVLEDQPGEFSYPAVIQTSDGLVHITYTWKRRNIKHAVLDPARLDLRPIVDGQWPP
jgi:predicted neuraminidase